MADDNPAVSASMPAPAPDPVRRLLALYDRSLPNVYGYLVARVRDRTIAEDLTAETFLAAARAVRGGDDVDLTAAWLITVARNKLVDHWRRAAREQRALALAADNTGAVDDETDLRFDRMHARNVLAGLAPQHRAALTLRYVDDLPVADVADALGRTVHATEALLVRARNAFRASYQEGMDDA